MLTINEAVEQSRQCLEPYLQQKGIDTRNNFHCLNPEHIDKKPSMSLIPGAEKVYCFSCGSRMDIFDLMKLDYGIDDFKEQVEKVCELFNIDFSLSSLNNKKKKKHSFNSLSFSEMELIGLNWKGSTKTACVIKSMSYQKPENFDKRLPKENDIYLNGEIINGAILWYDLMKDRKAYEFIVREKSREKLYSIIKTILDIDEMLKEKPDNDFLIALRKEFEDIRIQVTEIYKRFHGKISYQPVSKIKTLVG